MNEKFKKGDLVRILYKPFNNILTINPKPTAFKTGIIIDVITKSIANPDWEVYLVYTDGWCDTFPNRRLISYAKNSI